MTVFNHDNTLLHMENSGTQLDKDKVLFKSFMTR